LVRNFWFTKFGDSKTTDEQTSLKRAATYITTLRQKAADREDQKRKSMIPEERKLMACNFYGVACLGFLFMVLR
jgi:hypothetical protein